MHTRLPKNETAINRNHRSLPKEIDLILSSETSTKRSSPIPTWNPEAHLRMALERVHSLEESNASLRRELASLQANYETLKSFTLHNIQEEGCPVK